MVGRKPVSLPAKLLTPLGERLGLIPRSAMLTSRYSGVRKLGTLAFALRMLSTVRRTKWLYSRGSVPATRIECRAPTPVGDADVELCQRLIAAYSRTREREPNARSTEGMWSWIFDARQHDLAATSRRRSDRGSAIR